VLLEAAAAGRPVVTTDIGGGTGLLHAVTGAGLVVPWNDAGSWSEALARLLDYPKEASDMGREARRRLEAIYGPGGVAPNYVEFFEEVVGGGR
jgi:glycosyltransferase involved in cell wall biosynthesis